MAGLSVAAVGGGCGGGTFATEYVVMAKLQPELPQQQQGLIGQYPSVTTAGSNVEAPC